MVPDPRSASHARARSLVLRPLVDASARPDAAPHLTTLPGGRHRAAMAQRAKDDKTREEAPAIVEKQVAELEAWEDLANHPVEIQWIVLELWGAERRKRHQRRQAVRLWKHANLVNEEIDEVQMLRNASTRFPA